VTVIWSGLTTGALYALVGVGYNIVLLASGVFNFSTAQLIMVGTYMAYVGAVLWGLPFIPVVIVGAIVVAGIAFVVERVAFRPLMNGKDPHATLITSVGAAVIIDGIVLKVLKDGNPRTVPSPFSQHGLTVLGGVTTANALAMIIAVLIIGIGLHIWSVKTIGGLASLASAEDRQAAMARGVNVRRLGILAFIVTGLIMGAMGPIVGAQYYAVPTFADGIALYGFVAIAIGGSGSQLGALIGGFATGLIYAEVERYTNADWPAIVVFAVFLVILLTRPRGLFGGAVERQV
jgi:branched-chain amino acid transport system permease protein